MVGLEPLLAALSRACLTCDHIHEEESHGESRLIADMLDAKTRELAARTRQLDDALQRARDVSRLKEELLASMSHELRTPLNAVLGLAEALQEEIYGSLNPQQTESIKVIETSGRELLSMLTDIMDFARIGAGLMETQLHQCEVGEVAEIAMGRARGALKAKGLRVTLDAEASNLCVLSDASKCQRIVDELLSNAIKFTSEGGRVGIDISATEDTVDITVWDTGCGIPADRLGQLFEPFVQLRGGLKRRHGGAGLGLALNARLARLIGARLEVSSAEGQGSRFTLTLPIERPRQIELFGDLNCPFSHTLNEWIEQTQLGHLVAWRGVEHMPELSTESAKGAVEQRRLDEEIARVTPRCEDIEICRPDVRSNTREALCVLKYIERQLPGRAAEARQRLFRAIWGEGRDISSLDEVREVLHDVNLDGYAPGGADLHAVQATTATWRAEPDPCIPTVVSPTHGTQHRGLGHRALLEQFLDEELGFVTRHAHREAPLT
jgi:signal transduction histidine kinase